MTADLIKGGTWRPAWKFLPESLGRLWAGTGAWGGKGSRMLDSGVTDPGAAAPLPPSHISLSPRGWRRGSRVPDQVGLTFVVRRSPGVGRRESKFSPRLAADRNLTQPGPSLGGLGGLKSEVMLVRMLSQMHSARFPVFRSKCPRHRLA